MFFYLKMSKTYVRNIFDQLRRRAINTKKRRVLKTTEEATFFFFILILLCISCSWTSVYLGMILCARVRSSENQTNGISVCLLCRGCIIANTCVRGSLCGIRVHCVSTTRAPCNYYRQHMCAAAYCLHHTVVRIRMYTVEIMRVLSAFEHVQKYLRHPFRMLWN